MPKITVHEHRQALSGEGDIRLARKIATADSEPVTPPPEKASQKGLCFAVTGADGSHVS